MTAERSEQLTSPSIMRSQLADFGMLLRNDMGWLLLDLSLVLFVIGAFASLSRTYLKDSKWRQTIISRMSVSATEFARLSGEVVDLRAVSLVRYAVSGLRLIPEDKILPSDRFSVELDSPMQIDDIYPTIWEDVSNELKMMGANIADFPDYRYDSVIDVVRIVGEQLREFGNIPICPICGCDFSGNASGKCPECHSR